MMKSEELFVLIKSLSKSEKRYFKLFCMREASGGNYLKLFNAIDNQQKYDEKKLKTRFKQEKFARQLHVTKNYLRKMILKSLRNFHSRLSKDAELKDLLRNVEILYNKELYQHCQTEIKRAETIARKFELYTGVVEVLTWKRKLEQAIRPHNYELFQALIAEQRQAVGSLQNNSEYWQLAIAMSNPQNDYLQATNIKLLTDIENAKTLEAKILHCNSAYFGFLRQEKFKDAEKAMFDLIALFEEQPHRILEDASLYAASINNFLSYMVFRKKYEPALGLIGRAKSVYETWKVTPERKALLKQILRTYNIELEVYRDTRSYDEHLSFIDSTEDFISLHILKIPKEYLVSFWFQLANIHFMRGDFSRSLHWINMLLNAKFSDIRTDLHVQARMLNLMVHLEQQNLFVLRYFVDSTRRFIRKFKQLEEHEKILLRFFSRISNTPLLEYRDRFAELHERLFPVDEASMLPEAWLDFIDYKKWIEDKSKK